MKSRVKLLREKLKNLLRTSASAVEPGRRQPRLFMRWPGLAAFIALLVTACALPVPQGVELGSFVPDDELVIAYLAREGMNFFNQNRFLDAELRFRQVLCLRPDLENIKHNLAVALENQGLCDEAVEIYQELLSADPEDISRRHGLGRVYYTCGQFEESSQEFSKALSAAMDANDGGAMANSARSLAVVNFKIGNEEEALCYSAMAYALRPGRDELLRHSRLLLAAGKGGVTQAALAQYMSERSHERDPVLLLQRAMAAFAQEKFDEANDYLNIARQSAIGRNTDPAASFEMKVLQSMLADIARQTVSARSDEEEDEEGQREEFTESLRVFVQTNAAHRIYWPANLVEMVQAALEGQEK